MTSSTHAPRITLVAGARPNFMKVAPVLKALEHRANVTLVHTGQHYDDQMSGSFFRDLEIREPDVSLGIGSGSHAQQTAGVLVAFERHLTEAAPDAVVVVGDVNSSMAATLAASKLGIPVAHVEAGLRSRDWAMPEEINRVVTDRLSRWLLTTSADADANLLAEGEPPSKIHLVGNVMIDSLLSRLEAARSAAVQVRAELNLDGAYSVMTLHRPSNVDEPDTLRALMSAVTSGADGSVVVFPVHPRTRYRLLDANVNVPRSMVLVDPLPFTAFIGLVDGARFVVTDSGGIQEETSVLGIPCLTLRTSTERPVTCTLGTNELVGTDPDRVEAAVASATTRDRAPANIPLWDGRAAERVADVLLHDLTDG